jgi:hypothetical protein
VTLGEFSGKKKGNIYLKDKINKLETNSKNKISETCTKACINLRRVTNLRGMK